MLSTCCPHVVHMLTVSVGGLLFSFESAHGKRRAKVLAFALQLCRFGFLLVAGLLPRYQWIASVPCRQKKKPGLYEAEYLWTWQTEKNLTLSISFVFRRFQCAIETHKSAFCILKVVQVSLCFKDGCLRTMAPRRKKAEGSGSGIISGWSGLRSFDISGYHILRSFIHFLILVNDSVMAVVSLVVEHFYQGF